MPPDLKNGKRVKAAARVDRLPPHSPEAEMGIISCAFMDPPTVVPATETKIGPESFYDLRHQAIWAAIVDMMESGKAVDMITLHQHLKDNGKIEAVGGLPYLMQLEGAAPSAANASYYSDIICEKELLRKMVHACTDAVGRIYDYEGNVDALLDEVERDVLEVRNRRKSARAAAPVKDVVRDAITLIEDMWQNKGALTGIPTGLADLDKSTGGLQNSELTIVAAYPSGGKTALMLNIAEHAAVEHGLPVAIYSCEMEARRLMVRMIAARARVDMSKVSEGFMSEADFPKITGVAGKLVNARLYIDDRSGVPVEEVVADARRLHQQHGIKLFAVDYLQLLTARAGRRDRSREEEVSRIAWCLKSLAMETKAHVITGSQLNDDGALRESRAIGHHADNVWLLETEGDISESPDSYPVGLTIRKQRNGRRGVKVPLTFMACYTKFENAAKVADEDYAK